MRPNSTTRDSRSDLVDALRSGVLSGALAQQGQSILDQMRQPLRLSILGLPGSGKSTLMNLLLGASVVPVNTGLPTLAMTYGAANIARCTMADGTTREMDAAQLNSSDAQNAIFIEAEMPLPALSKLSVMEVVAGSTAAEQKRALSWAARRTDIALWCTQGFTAQEFALWDLIPEQVQDHSFMLLSKADVLTAQGNLNQLLEQADDAAGDRFRHILPIHAQGAIAATKTDGSVDKEALRISGGVALISAILREVETGKQAIADKADVFLRQIGYDPEAQPENTPVSLAPATPEPIAAPVVAAKPADPARTRIIPTAAPVAAPAAAPVDPAKTRIIQPAVPVAKAVDPAKTRIIQTDAPAVTQPAVDPAKTRIIQTTPDVLAPQPVDPAKTRIIQSPAPAPEPAAAPEKVLSLAPAQAAPAPKPMSSAPTASILAAAVAAPKPAPAPVAPPKAEPVAEAPVAPSAPEPVAETPVAAPQPAPAPVPAPKAEAPAPAPEAPKAAPKAAPKSMRLAVATPAVDPPAETPAVEAPVAAKAPAPAEQPAPTAQPAPAKTPDPAAPAPAPISMAARQACTEGAAQLEAEGAALAVELEAGRLTPDAVLEVTLDTISWLAEYLSDSGAANDPVLQKARNTANDAADLMQLIQLETGENVAADALSVMVQLKQELLAEIAA